MSDDVISTVQARISSEQARLADLTDEIGRLLDAQKRAEAEIRRLLQFADTYFELTGTHPLGNLERKEAGPSAQPTKRPKNPAREVVVEHVLEIIAALGRPASRRELFEALSARGIDIYGKDPEMVLSTMLWRSQDQVARLPKFGYWHAKVDYQPAGYYALLDDMIGVASAEPEDDAVVEDEDYEE